MSPHDIAWKFQVEETKEESEDLKVDEDVTEQEMEEAPASPAQVPPARCVGMVPNIR